MDSIERQVQLPSGAVALNQYARAYAFSSPRRVVAFYFRPDDDEYIDDATCQGAKQGGPTNAGQIALLCAPPDGMRPGERRWFEGPQQLPQAHDGGCNYINIEFDLRQQSVVSVNCNGFA